MRYDAGDYGLVMVMFSSSGLGKLLDLTGCSLFRTKKDNADLLSPTVSQIGIFSLSSFFMQLKAVCFDDLNRISRIQAYYLVEST